MSNVVNKTLSSSKSTFRYHWDHPTSFGDDAERTGQTITTVHSAANSHYIPYSRRKPSNEGPFASKSSFLDRSHTKPSLDESSISSTIDKELPDTPENKKSNKPTQQRLFTFPAPAQQQQSMSSSSVSRPLTAPHALAHASLGLGLSLPSVAPGPLFRGISDPHSTGNGPDERRPLKESPRSTQQRPQTAMTGESFSSASERETPRSNGSLDGGNDNGSPYTNGRVPTSDLPLSKRIQSKRSQTSLKSTGDTPKKELTKRASWWGRRRVESLGNQLPPTVPSLPSLAPSIPPLPPVSPLPFMSAESTKKITKGTQSPPTVRITRRSEDSSTADERLVVDLSSSPSSFGHMTAPSHFTRTSSLQHQEYFPSTGSSESHSEGPPLTHRPRSSSLFINPTAYVNKPSTMTASPRSIVTPSPPDSPSAQPRPRSTKQPPLLRRLSSTFFPQGSSPSSSENRITSPRLLNFVPSPSEMSPPHAQPRPKREENETPESYVSRLINVVGKSDIAGILASS